MLGFGSAGYARAFSLRALAGSHIPLGVIAGLDPAIQSSAAAPWIAGSSPAMTSEEAGENTEDSNDSTFNLTHSGERRFLS
jgi:hypothetical protein